MSGARSVPSRRWRAAVIGATSLVLLAGSVALASDVFSDVPTSHVFHDDITWLAGTGVTKGCNPPDNTQFCPDRPVSRGEVAAFLHRLSTNRVVDAGTLDGLDSSQLATAIDGSVRETAGATVNLITIPTSGAIDIQSKTLDAADGDFALVSYGAVFFDPEGGDAEAGVVVVWLQSNDSTCEVTLPFTGSIPGTLFAGGYFAALPVTVSGTVVIPTTDSPTVTMCAAEPTGNEGVVAATSQLNSVHVGSGDTTVANPTGSEATSGGLLGGD